MHYQADDDASIQPRLSMTLRGHHHGVRSVAFQPNTPRTNAIPNVISGGMDGAVMLWDNAATARAIRFTEHRGPVLSVAPSSRAEMFASAGQDGYVRVWTPNERRTSSTYCSLPTGTATKSACEWRAHTGATRAVAFAKDGSDRLYTIGDDKAVKSWDLATLSSTRTRATRMTNKFVGSFSASPVAGYTAAGHTGRITALAVQCPVTSSQFCHYVASGGADGVVLVWDTRVREAVHTVYGGGGAVTSLSFHPDGHVLASGDEAGDVNLFDLRRTSPAAGGGASSSSSYSLLQHYHAAHMGAGGVGTTAVDFASNGGWLLSAGDDGTAKMWDVREGHLYCTVEAHEGPVASCAFSPDAAWFVTGGGADRTVLIWRSGLAGSCPPRAAAPASSTSSACVRAPLVDVAAREPRVARRRTVPVADNERLASADTSTERAPAAAALQRPPLPLAPQPTPRVSLPHFSDTRADDSNLSHHTDNSEGSARERSFERCEARYSHLVTPPTDSSAGQDQQQQQPSVSNDSGSKGQEVSQQTDVSKEVLNGVSSLAADRVAREEQEQELLLAKERAHHREQRDRIAEERVANLEDAVAALVAYMQKQQAQQEERMNALQAANTAQAERNETGMAELKRAIALLTSRLAPESVAEAEEEKAEVPN